MKNTNLLEALRQRIIVADGAFGTLLYEKGMPLSVCYDALNLSDPEIVTQIHREYITAGAEVIETNTFGANRLKLRAFGLEQQVRAINRGGAELALACAGDAAWVAGAIGPIGRMEQETVSAKEKTEIFREHAEGLLEGGVRIIVLETFNALSDLLLALRAVKSLQADVLIIAQSVFRSTGKTIEGDDALTAFRRSKDAGADIVGANCGIGPHGLLHTLQHAARYIDAPVSAFPNAGFPEQQRDRLIYPAGVEYMTQAAVELAQAGVNLIGGCCGTTPAVIRAICQAVSGMSPAPKEALPRTEVIELRERRPVESVAASPSQLRDMLGRKTVISVELDPPKSLKYQSVLTGARELQQAGADVISIAENPLAVVRLSNVALSRMIKREVGIEPIVHLTGRDRNLIGMQSELMGMAVEGLQNILAITGDPPIKGKDEKETGVYDVRSFELIGLLQKFNQGQNFYGDDMKQQTAFTIGAAFNPNTQNMAVQAQRMRRKLELGAQFFQTQPVFSREKIDQVLELTKTISAPIFLGILPLLNSRNAEFLHNELPGISIPDEIRQRMRAAGDEHGVEEGIEIAWELIEYAYPHVGGIYLIPPFNKYRIAVELIQRIEERFDSAITARQTR